MSKIRILIADDHMLMRMGLAALFVTIPDMEVVGEAKNGRLAVELANKLKPDVIIMDLMMPELSGARATKQIHLAHPEIKIVILTTYGTSAELAEAVRNGAVATLLKDTAARNIVNDIRSVVAGKVIIPERLLHQIEEDNAMDRLTSRQLQLLSSVAKGYSNADIAKQFNQSEIWIKKQLSVIFKSLGVANRSEAVALALSKQLLKV